MIQDIWEFWESDLWDDDTWGEATGLPGNPSVLNLVGTYTPTIAITGRFET